ncbi:MAG: hypothetical protein ACFFBS_04925 [Promethearchaeota archaeon]
MSKTRDLITQIKQGMIASSEVHVGLFDSEGNSVCSTLGKEAEVITKEIIPRSFPLWDSGDYQVKNLGKSCLLVSRVSDKLALAINSEERAEMVIASLGILLRKFKDDFEGIDKSSPEEAAPASAAAEVPVPQSPVVVRPGFSPGTEKLASPGLEEVQIPQTEEEYKGDPKADKRQKKKKEKKKGRKEKKKKRKKEKRRIEAKKEMPRGVLWLPATR